MGASLQSLWSKLHNRLPWLRFRGSGSPAIVFSGRVMGTSYSLILSRAPRGVNPEHIHGMTADGLRRVEALMSPYLADSEVSRFNAATHTNWIAVSAETAGCVQLAIEVGRRSAGAYDITIGPVVRLWGFGPGPPPQGAPTREDVERERRRTGLGKVHTRGHPPAIRKTSHEITIDLSSVAKGLGVDLAAEALEAGGAKDYCLEVGGEIRVRGRNPQGAPWRVAIETPAGGAQTAQRMVPLTRGALATSGDYRIFREDGGQRRSHVIDPRTGEPIRHNLVSVSVLDESCARADAWATALLVAGPEEGADLALRERLSALFILRTAGGFEERAFGRGFG